MKKIAVVVATMVLAVSFAAAAWAERSNLLSEEELSVIQSVAEKAYPRGTRIFMVVDQEFFEKFTVISFIKEDHTLSFQVEVYAHRAKMSEPESVEIGERVGVKVIEMIEKILNEKPQVALGNILD